MVSYGACEHRPHTVCIYTYLLFVLSWTANHTPILHTNTFLPVPRVDPDKIRGTSKAGSWFEYLCCGVITFLFIAIYVYIAEALSRGKVGRSRVQESCNKTRRGRQDNGRRGRNGCRRVRWFSSSQSDWCRTSGRSKLFATLGFVCIATSSWGALKLFGRVYTRLDCIIQYAFNPID
jgi:hypothetical protein